MSLSVHRSTLIDAMMKQWIVETCKVLNKHKSNGRPRGWWIESLSHVQAPSASPSSSTCWASPRAWSRSAALPRRTRSCWNNSRGISRTFGTGSLYRWVFRLKGVIKALWGLVARDCWIVVFTGDFSYPTDAERRQLKKWIDWLRVGYGNMPVRWPTGTAFLKFVVQKLTRGFRRTERIFFST